MIRFVWASGCSKPPQGSHSCWVKGGEGQVDQGCGGVVGGARGVAGGYSKCNCYGRAASMKDGWEKAVTALLGIVRRLDRRRNDVRNS